MHPPYGLIMHDQRLPTSPGFWRSSVRGPWFTWTKHNFWGARRQRWRTADVVDVSTRGIGDLMLRVAHRRRLPLGAFSMFPLPELQAAAALMTLALERARRSSDDDAAE